MSKAAVIIWWLALSFLTGVPMAAMGAGTLALPWLLGCTVFMALIFCPVLALLAPAQACEWDDET